MAHRNHAVVWIDHSQARLYWVGTAATEKSVLRPSRGTPEVHHGEKRTGHRVAEDRAYLAAVAGALADAGAILILGPADEKRELAKVIAESDPHAATRIVAVQPLDDATDGEIVDRARRVFRAAGRMRPQL